MPHKLIATLVLVVGALACQPSTEPHDVPDKALRFYPGPITRDGWARIEACAGRQRDIQSVNWYTVPGFMPVELEHHQGGALGFWDTYDNRIVVVEAYLDEPWVVRHEMLHAILRRTDHPAEYFERRCGAVIGTMYEPPAE
jgi:hypothetical protein